MGVRTLDLLAVRRQRILFVKQSSDGGVLETRCAARYYPVPWVS